ncbi:MAG: hypothetical protein OEW08_10060 [Gammaproteobacteria bacterium]|nr:hypothetical protein [Gammaproteobacteria bacterium]
MNYVARVVSRYCGMPVLLLALGIVSAHAESDDIAYVYNFHGRYTRAEVGTQDLLDHYSSAKLVYIFLKNHRFIYGVGQDDDTYFLSGGTDTYSDNRLVSTLDSISTPTVERQLSTRPSTGRCEMTGELENSVTVVCKGKDAVSTKDYHFVFVSEDAEATFSPGHEPEDVAANVKHAMFLFDELYRERGMEQVQDYLQHCYITARATERAPPVIACGAIDFASAFIEEWASKNQRSVDEEPLKTAATVAQRLTNQLSVLTPQKGHTQDYATTAQLVVAVENFSRHYLRQMMVKRNAQ